MAKKKLTKNQRAYEYEIKRITKMYGGDIEKVMSIIPPKQQRVSKKRLKLLRSIKTPYVDVGDAMVDVVTGELIEQAGEYQPQQPQPAQDDSVGSFSHIVINNIRAKIDNEWDNFYYKPYTLHIPNANYFSGYLEGLIQAYSEEEVATALERMGSEAITLASAIIYASKQNELEQRVDSFINQVYRELGEEFDSIESQYLSNLAEANWFN